MITDGIMQLFHAMVVKAAKFRGKYLRRSGPDVRGRQNQSTNEDMILFSEWMIRTAGAIIG